MQIDKKEKGSAVKGVLLLLLVQLLMFAASFLLSKLSFFNENMAPSAFYLVTIFQQVLIFFLPAYLLFSPKKEKNNPLYTNLLVFPPWKTVLHIGLCAVSGFFFFYHVSAFWLLFLDALGISFQETGAIPLPKTNIELLLALLAVGVTPAFCEEFLFRGVLFQSFKKETTLKTATILTALLFALMHQSLPGLPTHLALGFLLTFLAARTGQIGYSILYHLFHNVASLLVSTYLTRWLQTLPQEVLTAANGQSFAALTSPNMFFTLIPTALITGFFFFYFGKKLFRSIQFDQTFLQPQEEEGQPKKTSPLLIILTALSLLMMVSSYLIPLF